ncbi:hypothetical protein QQP08_015880, partial [Theobroma cacao]
MSSVPTAFKDTNVIIRSVCAILSLGFGIKQHGIEEGWYDGGSIIFTVFPVVIVSTVSNFMQNRQFEKHLKESSDKRVEVVRDGHRQFISVSEVVVGDVVFLKTGYQIPADGLFLDGHPLKVDESSMTGESDHVEINGSNNPFVLSGTKVMDGFGFMLVTSVGVNTAWGEMMSSINRDLDEETPLQARLNMLTSYIGKIGLTVAILVLAVLLIRYFTGYTKDDKGNKEYIHGKTKLDSIMNSVVNIISAAITIVVVAIPEGLPLAVTLTLAYSMKQMMADHAMVRKLSACETMGSATTICTDKTGTLTLNEMKWENNNPFMLSGTKVMDGFGFMLVTSVGVNTAWGEMMSSINRDLDEETPLQARLNMLTSYIGKIGLTVAILVLAVLLIRYFTGYTKDDKGNKEYIHGKTKLDSIMNSVVNIISAAITIVVVAIPEGLPLAVTLTLAYSMKQMMADHALVRKLSACETMGSATTICTDKTGTLTLNEMKVTEFWLGKECMKD